MDVRIKATDYQLTPETERYLMERLEALKKFVGGEPELARYEVEIGRDAGRPRHGKNIWFAEIRVVSPGEEPAYARNNSESVNGAIDDVKEEVERQLRKRKRFHLHAIRRGGVMLKRLLRLEE